MFLARMTPTESISTEGIEFGGITVYNMRCKAYELEMSDKNESDEPVD